MKLSFSFIMACMAINFLPVGLQASPQEETTPTVRETVTPVFSHDITNIPGKKLISAVVSYPPGAKSFSHHHAASAFIYAYVLSGAIKSQVNDEPVKVYKEGECWYESPGAHHKVSENASKTKPAKLLAVFVVDAKDQALTTPDSATKSKKGE